MSRKTKQFLLGFLVTLVVLAFCVGLANLLWFIGIHTSRHVGFLVAGMLLACVVGTVVAVFTD